MSLKKFSLSKKFKSSWNYVKESRNFIYSGVAIFVFFALIGFFIPAPDLISQVISEFLKQLVEKTKDLPYFGLIGYIFLNNVQSSFFGMIFGFFAGIFPVITLLINGYVLGYVSQLSVSSEGFGILWRLLPHGIFEIPALFISLGIGIKLGSFIFSNSKKPKYDLFKEYLVKSLEVFIYIVIPLLIIAAIIESSLIFFVG